MTQFPSRVTLMEEGPREGFQSEPGPIPTERKVALIDALSDTGLRHIQVASFVSLRRVPGMADADRLVREMTPRAGVEYTAIWFNDEGLERARASGRLTLEGKIRLYPSDAFLRRNLNRGQAEHLAHTHAEIRRFAALGLPVREASVSSAFGCNLAGDIPVTKVLALVDTLPAIAAEHGLTLEILTLADTMAWATPEAVKRLVGAVRERHPGLRIKLHLHDTRGMGMANAYAGLEMGVDLFDTSIAGLGGCPFARHRGAAGNLCTEDFVFLCEEMGIATGIDLEAAIACAELAEAVVGHPLPGSVMKGGSLARLRSGTDRQA